MKPRVSSSSFTANILNPERFDTSPTSPSADRRNSSVDVRAKDSSDFDMPASFDTDLTRNTRAPHFTPQHWLLCHMGLY